MQTPEEYSHIPQLTQITDAYMEIKAHNSKHTGLGVAMVGIVRAAAESDDVLSTDEALYSNTEEPQTSMTEMIGQVVSEGDMNAELQDIFHGDTFLRIGIKIAPLGESIVSVDGNKATTTELVPMIENTELFVEFLSTLNPEAFEDNVETLTLIRDTLQNLQTTIFKCFKKPIDGETSETIEMKREYGVNALRTFIAIDEQYQRLGLRTPAFYQEYLEADKTGMLDDSYKNRREAEMYARSYNELENYVKYWGGDVLEEYIEIGPIDRLSESKAWVIDGMQDRFDEEIDSIIRLIGPEKTTKLGIEAANAELAGIRTALHQMDDPDNWMNTIPGSREIFEKRIKRLQSVIGEDETQN